jgi:hypothetical protein
MVSPYVDVQQWWFQAVLPGVHAGMSFEAGNRRKSPVTIAVTAGYFFSLKKILRENLSSIRGSFSGSGLIKRVPLVVVAL